MDLFEALKTRRSVRRYSDKKIPAETIDLLIDYGCHAASGMNSQPWGFVTIEGKETIRALSDQVRIDLNKLKAQEPFLSTYSRWLDNPDFNFFFNHTQTLVRIYGDSRIRFFRESCTLAASNIMLAAHGMGIGTCWIGFAFHTCNTPEFRKTYQVPNDYELVAVLTLGYKRDAGLSEMPRNPAIIFNRKS